MTNKSRTNIYDVLTATASMALLIGGIYLIDKYQSNVSKENSRNNSINNLESKIPIQPDYGSVSYRDEDGF